MKIFEKVPGKLYIIGEYNVLKSGHSALIAPVNLFLQGTLIPNGKTTIIEGGKTYLYHELLNKAPHQLENTVATITFFNEYLESRNLAIREFEYTIENNLINDEQIKYGLGSSAASIVLTLKLLNRVYNTNLSPLTLFKMAVLIQRRVNTPSSGGDLAVALYDVPLFYTRYDLEWLLAQTEELSLLDQNWPLLNIKLLTTVPFFLVGWTKETTKPSPNGIIDPHFYIHAQKLVENYFLTFDPSYITQYQDLLVELSFNKKNMMTPKLNDLVKSAKSLGIAAKVSGAGYGDCGIAQISDPATITPLVNLWHNNDIEVLDIWRKDNE